MPIDARPALLSRAQRFIEEAGFHPRQAHCALEVKAPRYWDKGCGALCFLHTTCGRDWSERMCTIYVGDDIADEYAFYVI